MGKAKRLKKLGSKVSRPGPLGDQLTKDEVAQPTGRRKSRPLRKDDDEEVCIALIDVYVSFLCISFFP